MSSILELVISSVGAEKSAEALARVRAALQENAEAIRASGLASAAAAVAEAELTKIAEEETAARRAQLAIETEARVERAKASQAVKDQAEAEKTLAAQQAKAQGQRSEATTSLIQMAAAVFAVRAVYSELTGAIGEGAHFAQLSLRTGENIRMLVVEEQAFKNSGLGADFLARSANLLEKTLGGLDANGGKANATLKRLGTSVEELKPLSQFEQLQVLSAGFAKIENQSDRAAIAMKLFGRSGAEMLQLFGQDNPFGLAESQVGSLADRMQRAAPELAAAQRQLNGIKAEFQELGIAAAQQVLPALRDIAALLGALNFGGIGTGLGVVGPTAAVGLGEMFGAAKLEASMAALATKLSGTTRGAIAGAVAETAGMLATALPFGLAAAVAAEIVAGIITAHNQGQIEAWQQEMSATDKLVSPFRKGAASAQTDEAWQQNLTGARAELTRLQAERGRLLQQLRDNAAGTDHYDPEAQSNYNSTNAAITKLAALINNLLAKPDAARTQIETNRATAADAAASAMDGDALAKKLAAQRVSALPSSERRAELVAQQDKINQGFLAIPDGASSETKKKRSDEAQFQLNALAKQIEEIDKAAEAEKKRLETEAKRTAMEQARREAYALETQAQEAHLAGDDALAKRLGEQAKQKTLLASLTGVDLEQAQARLAVEGQISDRLVEQQEEMKAQAAIRTQLTQERTALDTALGAMREQLADLESDTEHTDAEKWAARKQALMTEAAALRREIARNTSRAEEADDQGHTGAAGEFRAAANADRGKLAGTEHALTHLGTDPNDPVAQMRKALKDLQKEWGTTAQQIGGSIKSVIGGAVQSVSQNISAAIVGTETWRQAFARIGLAIEESIIQALVEMGVKYVATKIMMAVADKGTAAANLAALIPIAAAESEIWAAPATLATIASFGGAAEAAPIDIALAMAATQGLALASDGGFFPGDPAKARGVFHGDEFVFSAPAVRAIGADRLSAVHSAARSAPASFAKSASSGAGAFAPQPAPNIHMYFDRAAFLSALHNDVTGIAHEVYDKRARSGS